MNYQTHLHTAHGFLMSVDPRWRVAKDLSGYLISNGHSTYIISHGEDGELDDETAIRLIAHGVLCQLGSTIATNPVLSDYLLHSTIRDPSKLLTALGVNATSGRGLEVGCGSGHIIAILVVLGLKLDGIDSSIENAKQALLRFPPSDNNGRIFAAPIESFISPATYAWAFSSGDCILGLREQVLIRSHFRAMAHSLKSGAPYLFRFKICNRPWFKVEQINSIEIDSRKLTVKKTNEEYSHLKKQIIEKISIYDVTRNCFLHEEYRAVASFSSSEALELFSSFESFQVEKFYSADFQNTLENLQLDGDYWILLCRK